MAIVFGPKVALKEARSVRASGSAFAAEDGS
jgi:hypothetical protein